MEYRHWRVGGNYNIRVRNYQCERNTRVGYFVLKPTLATRGHRYT